MSVVVCVGGEAHWILDKCYSALRNDARPSNLLCHYYTVCVFIR